MSRARDLGDVGSKANFLDNVSTDLGDYSGQSIPHIVPRYLHPAVEGKSYAGVDLKSLVTAGSYVWGDVYSGDNLRYFYTDIKGSKPIKDPRIGGHFGSQRHITSSIQLLEQETATHGENVYSVDGREWMRVVGSGVEMYDDPAGHRVRFGTANEYMEIVGYFSDLNLSMYTASGKDFEYKIDGGTQTTANYGLASVSTPLTGRYVREGSSVNANLNQTLGIHTIRLVMTGTPFNVYNIELITQDTSNRNNIQIPSQNVVSYGKKFTVSGTPHYNPFAQSQTGADVTINSSTTNTAKLADGWSGTGATYYSSELDTATSLGLSAWESGGDFYRPVNGGRVVWWVNSSGSLKCSVNMMPPAGTGIGTTNTSGNVPTGQQNWATQYQPVIHSTTIDHTQAEVAKTFHWREFGNGSANGNASYTDASTLNADGNFAYVMDDGLSSYVGSSVTPHSGSSATGGSTPNRDGIGDYTFTTFIGTGFSWANGGSNIQRTMAQNLPYGTHIIKCIADGSSTSELYIDGIILLDADSTLDTHSGSEFSVYQPKRPPIPEDACVLADYMLMADYVKTTNADNPSKGIRRINCSRDWFYNSSDSTSFTAHTTVSPDPANVGSWGLKVGKQSAWNASLPYFGTQIGVTFEDNTDSAHELDIDGSSVEGTKDSLNNASHGYADMWIPTATVTLGVHTIQVGHRSGGYRWAGGEVATPIHTSHHYQSFETPFLHELVGGDRNMEQTNLVCNPDGKTWDQITRVVSYIKNISFIGTRDGGSISAGSSWFSDYVRGEFKSQSCVQKDIAIAYDRLIFLQSGTYAINWQPFYNNAGWAYVNLNSTSTGGVKVRSNASDFNISKTIYFNVKRGDYLYINADNGGTIDGTTNYYTTLSIEKV